VRVNPKPVRERGIPVLVGGNSDAAMRRVVKWGDGWYGFNLRDVAAVAERVAFIRRLCGESGRDPGELQLAVALEHLGQTDLHALSELGIDELVIVDSPPDQVAVIPDWVAGLAAQFAPDLPDPEH
jgi:alkanesulfonate monooxygenase SsuD/methylene tetrahydromethanopterin reductase-like flavin-dependent oxidoreductase (luciferase family)